MLVKAGFVACIQITSRYIVVSSSPCGMDTLGVVSAERSVEYHSTILDAEITTAEQLRAGLRAAIECMLSSGSKISSLTIASCRELYSVLPEDRSRPSKSYGVIAPNSENPAWTDFDLYGEAIKVLEGKISRSNVFVHFDVALGALGEFHYRATLRGDYLFESHGLSRSGDIPPSRRKSRLKGQVHVYIKLSDTVEGHICYGGEILPTRRVAQMGSWLATPLKFKGWTDQFPSVCETKDHCFSGMISSIAIEKRLNEVGLSDFHNLKRKGHIITLIAFYTAQLCYMINQEHFPTQFTLGGRVIDDSKMRPRLNFNCVQTELPWAVWKFLQRRLASSFEMRRLKNAEFVFPDCPDDTLRDDISRNFVKPASCRFPVVHGGLVFALQKYQDASDGKLINLPALVNVSREKRRELE